MKNIVLLVFFILTVFTNSFSQINLKDSVERAFLVDFAFGYNLPDGDLVSRFGSNFSVSHGVKFKNRKNWILEYSSAFLFGSTVKEDIMSNITTSQGEILDENGLYGDILLMERGFTINLNAGKVIPIFGSNKNSGLFISSGWTFLQHKIRIENQFNVINSLSKEYKKGYDRLTNGGGLNQFVGYIHLDDNKISNFYAGFEFIEAFTKNRRSYNYDTMQKDNAQRLDILYGFKLGWILPIYRKVPHEYYYD
ncbi:MAG: hypothetical protein COC01_10680 [Bacteroidetes bacterium]|nr:hypothetical protein [Sphingobacteriaceae bacterium AH-315-L07]PCH64712.1 MAG: hypothetical protein COC01_10680 [Bacteroidota bacterium]